MLLQIQITKSLRGGGIMETELILGLATIGVLGMGFILKIGSESGRTTK